MKMRKNLQNVLDFTKNGVMIDTGGLGVIFASSRN